MFATSVIKTTQKTLILLSIALFARVSADAQVRNYGLVYSDNIKGDVATFGNTLMTLGLWGTTTINPTAGNDNALDGNSTFTNNYQNMLAIDIDGNTGDGAGTRNSSTSDLILPGGTNNIILARLYWGGRAKTNEFNLDLATNRSIKIRKGTSGAYSEFAAQQFDRQLDSVGTVDEFSLYQAYTDVTAFIAANGAGTYSVGNAPLSTGDGGNAGNYGGWSLVVVYQNDALPFSSVRVYDGFQEVWSFGNVNTTTVTITGLDAPSGILSLTDAKMTMTTWEGDANFKQDYLKINDSTFSNGINPADNPMNGTISQFGNHVTTKNPNYTNQFGIDIDEFYIGEGYGILPNANTLTLQFGTELDQYFPGVFSFVIRMKEPSVSLTKTVTDASNNGTIEAGEELTYRLVGKNTGLGDASAVVLTDTLPNNITYVPGSLNIIYNAGSTIGSQTDASSDDLGEFIVNGQINTVRFRLGQTANATNGGRIAAADSFIVEFKAIVNTPSNDEVLAPVTNIARLTALSDANETFVDDGIAIILPPVIDLPVQLTSFSAIKLNTQAAKVSWSTAQENNSNRFEIERSIDGRNFSRIATVSAAGNSNTVRTYQLTDNLNLLSAPFAYYRLKQIDNDGHFVYSQIVSIKLKAGGQNLTIAPNPFRDFININMESTAKEMATLNVFNVNGNQLITKQIQLEKGSNIFAIDELKKWPAGTYYIQIKTNSYSNYKQVTKL
jgi:uncharacterized repeat protein (TIGR01451 family)